MKKLALIKNNIVENIAAWNGMAYFNPQGYDHVIDVTNILCGIGFIYNEETEEFTPPQYED